MRLYVKWTFDKTKKQQIDIQGLTNEVASSPLTTNLFNQAFFFFCSKIDP